jgi:hypothetical protein
MQTEYNHDADMRKTAATLTLISALIIAAAAGTYFVGLGKANPFTNSQYSGKTGAPSSAPSPVVSIFSPEINREYNTDSITLTFNASVEEFSEGGYNSPAIGGMRIDESYYTADWLPNSTQIDLATYLDPEEGSNRVSVSVNLTGIPDGKRVIRVYVLAEGVIIDPFHWYTFETVGYSRVNFTIDTIPPSVSVFPIGNETYAEPEVPLNFTVNESTLKISYVLDGMDNVTVEGNTTLSGLSNGEHSVTVYAWDAAGNIGASETVTFTIVEPFPTLPVATVSTASITATGAGLLVYFRKRRREAARA